MTVTTNDDTELIHTLFRTPYQESADIARDNALATLKDRPRSWRYTFMYTYLTSLVPCSSIVQLQATSQGLDQALAYLEQADVS